MSSIKVPENVCCRDYWGSGPRAAIASSTFASSRATLPASKSRAGVRNEGVSYALRRTPSKLLRCLTPTPDSPTYLWLFRREVFARSALEWVIDQYQVNTDKRSGITSDPKREDDPQYIVRLVGQVIRISLETVEIVNGMPDYAAEKS